jgi:SAM-dependent methyltransferase
MKKYVKQSREKTTLDIYADDYDEILKENLKLVTNDVSAFIRYKVEYLTSQHLSPKRILDFGCGIGRAGNFLKQAFPEAKLWGCDVSEQSIRLARENYPDTKFFSIAKPTDIELYSGMFDLVFVSCVLHHIIPEERLWWLESLAKALSLNGKIAIFEHNPYNPMTRHFVATCDFDVGVTLLSLQECKSLMTRAGLRCISSQYTLFFPWRTRFFKKLEKFLTWLPLGGQYCIIATPKINKRVKDFPES